MKIKIIFGIIIIIFGYGLYQWGYHKCKDEYRWKRTACYEPDGSLDANCVDENFR
jgi:hypothetical protein